MTLYESSYLKLTQLVTQLNTLEGSALSHSPLDCDLYIELLRRDRYTTTLRLTYWFSERIDGAVRQIADPDLTIRVCHDAKLVDVLSTCDRHRHRKLREIAELHGWALGHRWRQNIMLNKWLDYLLEMQHGF